MAQARILISGHVQGVFYRHSMREKARSSLLTGWVRNLANGMVEAEVDGPRHLIEQLIDWCRQGPPSAEVKAVEVTWLDEGELKPAQLPSASKPLTRTFEIL